MRSWGLIALVITISFGKVSSQCVDVDVVVNSSSCTSCFIGTENILNNLIEEGVICTACIFILDGSKYKAKAIYDEYFASIGMLMKDNTKYEDREVAGVDVLIKIGATPRALSYSSERNLAADIRAIRDSTRNGGMCMINILNFSEKFTDTELIALSYLGRYACIADEVTNNVNVYDFFKGNLLTVEINWDELYRIQGLTNDDVSKYKLHPEIRSLRVNDDGGVIVFVRAPRIIRRNDTVIVQSDYHLMASKTVSDTVRHLSALPYELAYNGNIFKSIDADVFFVGNSKYVTHYEEGSEEAKAADSINIIMYDWNDNEVIGSVSIFQPAALLLKKMYRSFQYEAASSASSVVISGLYDDSVRLYDVKTMLLQKKYVLTDRSNMRSDSSKYNALSFKEVDRLVFAVDVSEPYMMVYGREYGGEGKAHPYLRLYNVSNDASREYRVDDNGLFVFHASIRNNVLTIWLKDEEMLYCKRYIIDALMSSDDSMLQ